MVGGMGGLQRGHDMSERPDVERELARLKDFQRATVEYVHRRLWEDDDAVKRFLVADEVGLGKTMVARGVIAKTIDHLWDTVPRIDVVYISSNAQIARQNLNRLNIGGHHIDHADRLTMLPRVVTDLRGRKLNFVSFTPGTSFQISGSGGRSGERVLIYWLLAKAWGRKAVAANAWLRFFQGGSSQHTFRQELQAFPSTTIEQGFADRFAADIARADFDGRPLRDTLEECVHGFRYLRGKPDPDLSHQRYRLLGTLRSLVAHAAVQDLEPDLVILDEFQRFKDLLDPDAPGADLAHAIFDAEPARVLLLSATPYKMYTLPDEPESDDHYADFLATVRFLSDEATTKTVATHLATMRTTLLSHDDRAIAEHARDAVETTLRKVMSRTERLAVTPERDGMLAERPLPGLRLDSADIRAYRSIHDIARTLDRHDMFEYWRSAPYVLNIMEGYKVKARLKDAIEREDPRLAAALTQAEGLLDREDIRQYRRIDPGNAKLRALINDVIERGVWRLLWIPPSLAYYTPAGAYADPELRGFTKRLVFSAWTVVPKAIAMLVSYEAERRMAEAAHLPREYDRRPTPLLRFQYADERPTGMPALAILYPSLSLAEAGDPLAAARQLGGALPGDRDAVRRHVRERVAQLLAALPSSVPDGPEDQRWYWAAPFLLDRHRLGVASDEFLDRMTRQVDGEEDAKGGLVQHVREARALDENGLGRRPADLVDMLADIALAAPGPCALRALGRVCGGNAALAQTALREHAFDLASSLRSLFNRPEAMLVLRSGEHGDETYWRAVVEHCLDGNLQAVLDEYLHVLVESEGLQDEHGTARADRLVSVVRDALTIRATNNVVDDMTVDHGKVVLTQHRVRAHLAARFGRHQTEDKSVQREGQVRVAFNSPFWPFVLASTSVGQEGLDFHVYCHAVVHWNLPGNPVDLEQREGRVHRYKGHAVRRNLARRFTAAATPGDDPWQAMFDAAHAARRPHENDLVPYWVFTGEAVIERYVPALPLSKETAQYQRLLRSVGAYRLLLGQPRQEDLMRYYANSADDLEWLRIDLSPRPGASG